MSVKQVLGIGEERGEDGPWERLVRDKGMKRGEDVRSFRDGCYRASSWLRLKLCSGYIAAVCL